MCCVGWYNTRCDTIFTKQQAHYNWVIIPLWFGSSLDVGTVVLCFSYFCFIWYTCRFNLHNHLCFIVPFLFLFGGWLCQRENGFVLPVQLCELMLINGIEINWFGSPSVAENGLSAVLDVNECMPL